MHALSRRTLRTMASSITLGDLKRITAPRLAEQLRAQADAGGDSIAVVDVRDDGTYRPSPPTDNIPKAWSCVGLM